jgi:hemoglobin
MFGEYMICESAAGAAEKGSAMGQDPGEQRQAQAGPSPLGEADLERLVECFYARVRRDEMLGPLFNAALDDWPDHLVRLQAFWSSVMLTTGRYKGSPMAAHLRHGEAIRPEMFDRWLALWRDTARAQLNAHDAAAIVARAERIAESLKLALFFRLDRESGRAAA